MNIKSLNLSSCLVFDLYHISQGGNAISKASYLVLEPLMSKRSLCLRELKL